MTFTIKNEPIKFDLKARFIILYKSSLFFIKHRVANSLSKTKYLHFICSNEM